IPWQPFGRSGARYSAPTHCSRPLPATSGHLGSPPRVPRGASTFVTRHAAGPLLLLPPLAPARTRGDRPSAPVSVLTRAVPLAPCSLSLFFPSLWTRLSSTPDTAPAPPEPCGDAQEPAGARAHGGPPLAYISHPRALL